MEQRGPSRGTGCPKTAHWGPGAQDFQVSLHWSPHTGAVSSGHGELMETVGFLRGLHGEGRRAAGTWAEVLNLQLQDALPSCSLTSRAFHRSLFQGPCFPLQLSQ